MSGKLLELDQVNEVYETFLYMNDLLEAAEKNDSWESAWQLFWKLDATIENLFKIDWENTDSSYEEDMRARYYAIRKWLRDLDIYT